MLVIINFVAYILTTCSSRQEFVSFVFVYNLGILDDFLPKRLDR